MKGGIIMQLKGIVMEDFVNYKEPSMFLISSICDWKCCKEANNDICQNSDLAFQPSLEVDNKRIYNAYIKNDITSAIVIGGLEPMLQFDEIVDLISLFRFKECKDTFIIYTGYYPDEISEKIERLKDYTNIIIKFGRFIPNRPHIYDELLGVELASDNQYSIKIS